MRGNRNAAPVANDKNGTQIKFKDSEYYPKKIEFVFEEVPSSRT